MARTARGVRGQRSGPVVAVTGAAGGIGAPLVDRLAESGECRDVIGIDTAAGPPGVTWRRADARDPAIAARLDGVDVLVHVATDRRPDAPTAQRRAVNVRGTQSVLGAAAASGVSRVVLLTSAMVYGANPDNPVPLPDDAPLRAEPDPGLVGDWVEMERLAARAARSRSTEVVVVRPASVLGAPDEAMLPRLFEAPRLLAIRGARTRWQFCHVDDLVEALVWAALGKVRGSIAVACEGYLEHEDVERITGLRSVVVPAVLAFGTAERLHRAGVLPAPASDLRYVAHPWVVSADRLRAAGWVPRWDNAGALAAHVESLSATRGAGRLPSRDTTRAAAGAAVAVAGAVAIARARAARRRRRG